MAICRNLGGLHPYDFLFPSRDALCKPVFCWFVLFYSIVHTQSSQYPPKAWLIDFNSSSQNSWKHVICLLVCYTDVGSHTTASTHPPSHASYRSLHKFTISLHIFIEASWHRHGWLDSSLLEINLAFISFLVPRACRAGLKSQQDDLISLPNNPYAL